MKRRHFLAQGMGGAALSLAGWSPAVAQNTANAPRLLVVMLRGGLDGLAALAPVGDARYASLRPNIVPQPMLALNADWALHPALPTWHALWQQGQMAAVHSAGLAAYSGRSHFEAQDMMQSGVGKPYTSASGWLGRAMQRAGVPGGVALSIPMPLLLRGHESSTTQFPNWMPRPGMPLIEGLATMWRDDPMLAPYAAALREEHRPRPEAGMARTPYAQARSLGELARQAAQAMRQPDGPRIGLIDFTHGFDTHASQGNAQGALADQLRQLDQVLAAYREGAGPMWAHSLVITLTEFGRTAAENGNTGTDHGVGSCILMAGGLLTAAQVFADWRGLAPQDLFEGRDLPATIDLHAVHARVLQRVLGLTPAQIQADVLAYRDSPKLQGLLI